MANELQFAANQANYCNRNGGEKKYWKKTDIVRRLTPITIVHNHFGCYIELLPSLFSFFLASFCSHFAFAWAVHFLGIKCQFEIKLPHRTIFIFSILIWSHFEVRSCHIHKLLVVLWRKNWVSNKIIGGVKRALNEFMDMNKLWFWTFTQRGYGQLAWLHID